MKSSSRSPERIAIVDAYDLMTGENYYFPGWFVLLVDGIELQMQFLRVSNYA